MSGSFAFTTWQPYIYVMIVNIERRRQAILNMIHNMGEYSQVESFALPGRQQAKFLHLPKLPPWQLIQTSVRNLTKNAGFLAGHRIANIRLDIRYHRLSIISGYHRIFGTSLDNTISWCITALRYYFAMPLCGYELLCCEDVSASG